MAHQPSPLAPASHPSLATCERVLRDDSSLPYMPRLARLKRCFPSLGWPLHRYEQALRDNNALDFDDLLGLTVGLLRGAPAVRERLARHFRCAARAGLCVGEARAVQQARGNWRAQVGSTEQLLLRGTTGRASLSMPRAPTPCRFPSGGSNSRAGTSLSTNSRTRTRRSTRWSGCCHCRG